MGTDAGRKNTLRENLEASTSVVASRKETLMRQFSWVHTVLFLVVATGLSSCASSQPNPDLRLDLTGNDLELTVSSDLARGLLEEALDTHLDCSGDLDPTLRAFLDRLAARPRSRASLRDDGTVIRGARRGGVLELKVNGSDGGRLRATLPWAVGECLLGDRVTLGDVLGRGHGHYRVEMVSADGIRIAARFE
jgi:hypothetical protein